jgi:hypothetical protein
MKPGPLRQHKVEPFSSGKLPLVSNLVPGRLSVLLVSRAAYSSFFISTASHHIGKRVKNLFLHHYQLSKRRNSCPRTGMISAKSNALLVTQRDQKIQSLF